MHVIKLNAVGFYLLVSFGYCNFCREVFNKNMANNITFCT